MTIPYIIRNFDMMELIPTHDDNLGNKAVEVRKRINGVSIVGTIARGKDKLFVVTSWKMEKSDALDVSSTPGPNVRNDSDIAKVKKEIEIIKEKAKNCSKVVDENGEPKVVYHGARAMNDFNTFADGYSWFTDNGDVAEMFNSENAYVLSIDGEEIPLTRQDVEGVSRSVWDDPQDMGRIIDSNRGILGLDHDLLSYLVGGMYDEDVSVQIYFTRI